MIEMTIPGEPMGKQRARVTQYGTYTPKKTLHYETYVKQLFAVHYRAHKPMKGPVKMHIRAFFKIPANTSKKRKKCMLSGEYRPTKYPDVDNIVKIIADALNAMAYDDDKQIVTCLVEKYYSETPRVQLIIKEEDAIPFERVQEAGEV